MNRVDNVSFGFDEIGSCSNGKTYHVQIGIPMNVGWIEDCFLVLEDGSDTRRIPMSFLHNKEGKAFFDVNLDLETRAVYRYFFEYSINHKKYFVTNRTTKNYISYDEKNKISVNYSSPSWAKGAVMYHIFVDRFYRGGNESMDPMPRREIHKSWDEDVVLGDNQNIDKHYNHEEVWNVDFFGGNLKGIEEKLDYLESLGVTLLYLSPIVRSQSNHRYDTADYETVDPYAGCNDDLKRLCDEAHRRGMKIILDAVFNHTGDESKYFDRYGDYKTLNPQDNGIFQNPQSKYHDFFRYNEKGENTFWWDFKTLPELNCDGDFWRHYICGEGGVIDQWFSLGIDGLRIDVADNLSDAALEEIRKAVTRNRTDGFILGEVWDNPMRNGRSYISSGKSMNSVMNYPLVDALVRYFKYQDPHKLSYVLKDIQAEYPKDTIDTLMNFTSTHDISRAMTLFGKKKFDTYHKFHSLDSHLQDKIFECLWELGYSNDDIYSLMTGNTELNYYQYQFIMNKLLEKGVSSGTITYLKKILSFSPFDPSQVWAKDLPEEIKKDLLYTKNYQLTKEEYDKAKEVYQSYLFFLATYPGIFSIFYGDEAGLEGLNNLANRRPFPWKKEDLDLLHYFQKLGKFRKDIPFLKDADFHLLHLTKDNISFERISDENQLFVSINNTDSEQSLYVPSEYQKGNKILSLKKSNMYKLDSHGGIVIKK